MSDTQSLIRNHVLEFIQNKKEKNYRFSVRMAARYLGVDHSQLSKFLNGKKKLGIQSIITIKKKLKITDKINFLKLDPVYPKNNHLKLEDRETFKEWYYYIILEYIQSTGKVPNVAKLAKEFGLTPHLVIQAIQSLIESGVVSLHGPEVKVLAEYITNFHNSENTIQIHKSFLKRSEIALDKWNEGSRSVHDLTIAIDSSQFSIYVSEIRKALAKINKLSVKNKKRQDKIFHLSVSFFPELEIDKY